MIERVNRQFQVLAVERKKFDQIIKTTSLNESLFKSYVTAIQSVSMTACNITQSFTEVLSYSQIKMLSKSVSQVVVELVSKLEQYNSTIRKMKSQKQQQAKKIKSQYCSICMQNIHENNIKQAKMYLEQEAKQNFHKAVQQVQKMANQPLFTKQQNNAYDQKLYLHLAQKQKVLNTNCRRMEEFVDIVNATLDDLSKLKDISIQEEIQGNVQYMSNFAPATKLGEQVSKFLKKSFSQKVPPWINKMLTRIMQWYLHQKSQKLTQKSMQTDHYESTQSKQLKQVIKQLQKISKQKQQLNEQLKILKTCNKKLEQINIENINIIANFNKLMKTKQNNNSNVNFRETSRNGKNNSNSLTKSGIKFVSKDVTPVSEEVQSSYINAIEDQVYNISKKKKTQINNALPQIKRNKVGTMRNLGRDLDYSDSALNYLNETEKDIKNGRNYEQTGKSMGKSHKHIQQRQLSPSQIKAQKDKDKQTEKDKQQIQKQKTGQKSGKISGNQHNGQELEDKRRNKQNKKQKKVMRSSIELKKEIKSNMRMLRENGEMKKSKQDLKLMKAGINRMSNVNQYGPYTSKSRDQSYVHLEQFAANSKMTQIKKKGQQYSELHNKIQQKQPNKATKTNNTETKQINMDTGKQNNENINQIDQQYCNQSIYTNELAVMKRISKDLSNQILNKKINLYNKVISNNVQNGNFNKNKEYSVEALNKYQIMNTRIEKPNNNKAVRQNYSLIQNLDTNNRSSSYERKQGNKQQKEKIRNSQNKNSYGDYKQRIKVQSKYSKMPEYGEQSLCSSWNESEQNQRKLFQILKNNKALNEHFQYEDFTSLFLTTQKQQKQPIDSSTSSGLKSPISKQYLHSRKPSNPSQLLNPSPSPQLYSQQKQSYINLFISKSHAYKYEQTMKKSYHRNKIRQLTQQQHEYCYEMFCNLIQCKKIQKQVYQQFCSIIRYPFQTLYNQFDVLNFITDITFDTFQYYFRKIVWMHRKCGGHGVVCQHVGLVGRELESIVKTSTQTPV